jgi:Mg2+/Co2+ transporter CorB
LSEIPLGVLVGALVVLIVISACFSGSETGMMALNRYRLRHLARHGHRGAQRASALLERPDRLLGLILLGNNFVNIFAASLTTIIALRLVGEVGLALAPLLLTLVVLIFAEVAPKTLAALHPERIAFPAAWALGPLLRLFYPLVAGVNWLANGLLRMGGVTTGRSDDGQLSTEELRTVVNEAGALISVRHRRMLTSILDLEHVTVDDIMIPRNEINGVDLEDPLEDIVDQIVHSMHTRLPLYRGDVDEVVGMLHLRRVLRLCEQDDLGKDSLEAQAEEPYFVPAGTPLHTQLRNFQGRQQRIALVVDEYGDVEGLVTLDDLLEEIVGEFTTDPSVHSLDVHPQPDGTFLVDGTANLRELNRTQSWEFPIDGPKTVNGLVTEYLEHIPEPGTSVLIAGYPVEIVQTSSNTVKTVRVSPALRRPQPGAEEA